MRQIGTIDEARDAKRFADYLLTIGIPARVEESPEGWAIWIVEEDDVPRAREELATFVRDPAQPHFDDAARRAEALRREAAEREKRFRRNFVDVGNRWRAAAVRRTPLTWTLVAISVAVAVLTKFGRDLDPVMNRLLIASVEQQGTMIRWHGLSDIEGGQVWRMVTPIFLHFNILHLVFNMLWLHALGGQIESRRGIWRMLVLVLALAAASNVGQYLVTHNPLFGGMSGVVYGLFGFIWMRSRFDPASGLFMDSRTVTLMILWFLLCFTGMFGPIANAAHGVGLVLGAALGYAPILVRKIRR